MKVLLALDIPTSEAEKLTGVSKSKIYREMQNGKDVGKLWENCGKALKSKVLFASALPDDFGKVVGKLWESGGKNKENEQEKVSPHTPYIKEKEKEKDLFPDIHLIAEYQCSLQENVKHCDCFTGTEAKKEKKKTSTFCPPTIAEVQRYVDDKGYHVDAEHFCAFYESNGWMVGKNHMKSWRMAVVTWEKTEKQRKKTYGQKNGFDPYSKRRGTEVIATSAKDYEGRF